jgi:hypothetical protein
VLGCIALSPFPLGSDAVNFEVLGHMGGDAGKGSVHGVDVNIDQTGVKRNTKIARWGLRTFRISFFAQTRNRFVRGISQLSHW